MRLFRVDAGSVLRGHEVAEAELPRCRTGLLDDDRDLAHDGFVSTDASTDGKHVGARR